MDDGKKKDPRKVTVHDRRRASRPPAGEDSSAVRRAEDNGREDVNGAPLSGRPSSSEAESAPPLQADKDFLDDLKRVQADFENYRKRVMRDQANVAARATAAVIEDLLPVLDNFERAISHGEGGEGVELVFKQLRSVLEREGLEEIAAEGAEFDPNVHEAVESREQPGLEAPTVVDLFRRGYLFKGQLLRPAMVAVGRPAEGAGANDGTA